MALGPAVFALVLGLSPLFIHYALSVESDYRAGRLFSQYQEAALWLAENTPPRSIVFHSDWDEFPQLFYYNTHNRYIVGLDPTFMYLMDSQLHEQYVQITRGQRTRDLHPIIARTFGAEYVFVDTIENQDFANNLLTDGNFSQVYQDPRVQIFRAAPLQLQ
jgi:hypothetical protein